jgi:cellulose synthase/poly-beta-1,6-N-acetylglucosamine synthase-like glycosyltransferase
MPFEYVLIGVLLAYLTMAAIFIVGLSRVKQFDKKMEGKLPFLSVVIAARNEEQHLAQCLDSVFRQTLDLDAYEVILINDRSSDRTAEIAASFASRYPNLSVIEAVEGKELRGKPNALAQGIDKAKGEIILMTDADCIVPPTWIEGIARRFTPEVGIVGSSTTQKTGRPFLGMQSLDWAYLHGISAASIALRHPLSIIGNNLSVRKKAYDEVGGYRNIRFSITEDFALFEAIVGTEKWDYRYPLDAEVLVVSEPCTSVGEIVRQKHRWGRGGVDIRLTGLLIFVIGFLFNASCLISLIWLPLWMPMFTFLVRMIVDYFYLHKILMAIHKVDEIKYFYWFEVYSFLQVLILPFIVFLRPRVQWKGRTF